MRTRLFQLGTITALLSAVFAPCKASASAFPSITTQPRSQTNFFGSNILFTVAATGQTPLSYQWSLNGVNLTDNGHVNGSTTATLTINSIVANDAGNYQVVVSNSHGSAASSNAALTVLVPAMITTPPSSESVLLNSNASFTAIVIGTAPVNYQWYFKGTPLTDGGRVNGSASANLSIANVQTSDGGAYQLVVTNNYGSATSTVVTLTVLVPAAITSGLSNLTVLAGSNVSLAITAIGTPPPSYQWSFNGVALTNGGRVSGSTTANLNIADVQTNDTGLYQVEVANGYGLGTNVVSYMTVVLPPGITEQPTNQSVLAYSNATFTAAVTGTAPLTAEWYWEGALVLSYEVTDPSSVILGLRNVQPSQFGPYQLVVTNDYGAVTSAVANLTVLLPPTITTPPEGESVFMGSNASFTAAAAGTPPLSLQWAFNGTPLTDGGRVSGSTTTNLIISDVQTNDAGGYQLIVTSDYGAVTSSVAGLTVLPAVIITAQPSVQLGLLNSNATFSASAAGDAPLMYQWYFNSVALSDGGRVSGSMTDTLSISNLQSSDAGPYYLVVTNNYGSATSQIASLTVFVPAAITAQPTNRTLLSGTAATFTVGAMGTPVLVYTWYSNGVALTDGGRISGSATPTLTISNVQTNDSGTTFQVIVTNEAYYSGSATSSIATLTVIAPVQITGEPASQAVLVGSNATFVITATGSGPLNYQWYFDGSPLTDGGGISGSATPVLTISNVQSNNAGGYVVIVTNLLSSATSLTASLTPQATLAPSTRYVALTSTNPSSPYLDWSTAATNIQDAVDAAVPGDTVVVSNGIYGFGGRAVYGTPTNRVVVNKAITVQSVNGPSSTIVQGSSSLPGTLQRPIARCAYLTNGAVLMGFTLTNGGSATSGDPIRALSGGGVWCESLGAIVSNCVIANSFAQAYGGGAFGGTLINCILTTNSATGGGGAASNVLLNCMLSRNFIRDSYSIQRAGAGAYGCTVSNSLLVGNTGIDSYGGGAVFSVVTSCTISNNHADYGAGVSSGIANNSLISSNITAIWGGGAHSNVLNNCVLRNNSAQSGGGAYGGTLVSCVVSNNTATTTGGVVAFALANDCLIVTNRAPNGAGAYSNALNDCILQNNLASSVGGGASISTLTNCTVVSNSVAIPSPGTSSGGGVYGCAAVNCIVYYNTAGNGSNFYSSSSPVLNFCCTTPMPTSGLGNITNEPGFVNLSGEDFHLQSSSPCINSGNNAYVTTSTDLDGNPRIVGGTVDIGAYEYQTPSSVISYAYLQQYGLPTDGTEDYMDLDGTGFNVYQDWIAGLNPTNAASVLVMLPPVATNNAAGISVSWDSVSGISYNLQRSTNLAAQPAFSTIQANITGQTGTTSYSDTTATNNVPYFYRVDVQH